MQCLLGQQFHQPPRRLEEERKNEKVIRESKEEKKGKGSRSPNNVKQQNPIFSLTITLCKYL